MGEAKADIAQPPTVVALRRALCELVAAGHSWHVVEDVFIGASAANAELYGRGGARGWH
jgi:hypothetical protein